MCLGGKKDPKVEAPRPSPLPPPIPAPPPPKPAPPPPKMLQAEKPVDIRIGDAKKPTTSGRQRRSNQLSISGGGSSNQGLNL